MNGKENGRSWGNGVNNRKFEREHPQRFGVKRGPGRYSGARLQPVPVQA